MKKLNKYCLLTWPKKKVVLESLILWNNKPFLDWTVMCNEKWILYDNWQPSAQWLGRVEAPQHFPKPILYPKTVMVTGSLLPVWSTTAFWIPVKRSHLRNMLSRLMWCTENCNTCSWSTRRTRFFCVTVLNHTPHDQHFKSWTNWATKFCLIYHIHLTSRQPTTTSSSILTTFWMIKPVHAKGNQP